MDLHRPVLGAACVVAALASPAVVQAETRYVDDGAPADVGDCTNAASPCKTIDYAVGQAQNGDAIRVAGGEYPAVKTSKVLVFIGEGADNTRVSASSGQNAFELPAGGALRSLLAAGGPSVPAENTCTTGAGAGIEVEPAAGGWALALADVSVLGGAGGQSGLSGPTCAGRPALVVDHAGDPSRAGSVTVSRSELAAISIFSHGGYSSVNPAAAYFDAPLSEVSLDRTGVMGDILGSGSDPGVPAAGVLDSGARLTVARSSLSGGAALVLKGGTATVDHSSLTGPFYGVWAVSGPGRATEATFVDSFLATFDTPVTHGYIPAVVKGAGQPASMAARGSTIVGGDGVSAGVSTEGGSAHIELVNSIVRVPPSAPDLLARGGPITASFSSFSTAVDSVGTVPSPGAGSNVSGDPQFVGPLTVGGRFSADPAAFRLQPSSPLVDRGDSSIVGAGETDLAGAARSLDGDGDCVARPDIGAFERQPTACVSRFRATNRVFAPARKRKRANVGRRRVRRGTTFLFRLSEAARFRIRIERVRGGRWVKGHCLKPRRRYRHRRRCRRYRKVGTISAAGRKGRNRKRFSGRIKGKALRRGHYRATIVATDADRAKSKPRRLRFRIVRR